MNFNDYTKEQRAPEPGAAKERRETSKYSSEFIKNHYGLEENEWRKLLSSEALEAIDPSHKYIVSSKANTVSYKEQQLRLKDILADTVSEFISSDDGVTPQDFCIILRNVLKNDYEYFSRQANKNKKVLDLLNYSIDDHVTTDC